MTFQVAEVSRPLTAVGQVCDKGNLVVFGPKGGFIIDQEGKSKTRFQRNNGIYELDLWIDDGENGDATGFPRPGK